MLHIGRQWENRQNLYRRLKDLCNKNRLEDIMSLITFLLSKKGETPQRTCQEYERIGLYKVGNTYGQEPIRCWPSIRLSGLTPLLLGSLSREISTPYRLDWAVEEKVLIHNTRIKSSPTWECATSELKQNWTYFASSSQGNRTAPGVLRAAQ